MFDIKKNEIKKFLNLSFLLFTLFFSRNILRNVKDGLVAANIGTESISFIAIWIHVPLAFLVLKIYSKLSQNKSLTKNFAIVLSFFLVFFYLFSFVIYPNKNIFHPSENLITNFIYKFPNFKWFIKIWGGWSVALFAVFSELWVTIICSISYWQLANKITSVKDAARFYIYFASLGQLSLVLTGPFTSLFKKNTEILAKFFYTHDKDQLFTKVTIFIVILISIISFLLYSSIEKKNIPSASDEKIDKKKSTKLSFRKSLKLISSNKYFMMICIITFSYSAIMSWSDGIITCLIKKMYTDLHSLCEFKGKIMSYTGFLTIVFSFLGSYILKKTSWKTVALIIPIITLVSGTAFFVASYAYTDIHVPCLSLAVLLSGIYSVLSKSAKYSLLDSTKEMTYIPLSEIEKQQGQASVDIVGDNIGKILGSGVQFIVLTLFPSVIHEDLVGVLFTLFFSTSLLWIYAVCKLGKMYEYKKTNNVV